MGENRSFINCREVGGRGLRRKIEQGFVPDVAKRKNVATYEYLSEGGDFAQKI
jgi:hypothetical protein